MFKLYVFVNKKYKNQNVWNALKLYYSMTKDPKNLRLPTFWKPKFVSLKNIGHICIHYKWQSFWIIFTIHITKDLPSQALKNGMDWFASSDSLRCWNSILLCLSKSLTELVTKITKTEQIWNDYAAKCKKLKIRMKDWYIF